MAQNPVVTITMENGNVIEGMDVVNSIAETRTDYSDRPLEDQRIKTMTVETFGVDYPEPEKM